jgi:hypothetical protein
MNNLSNFSQESKTVVKDSTIFPDKPYLKTPILTVCKYIISKGLECKRISREKGDYDRRASNQYFSNAEDYFWLALELVTLPEHTKESPKTDCESVYF